MTQTISVVTFWISAALIVYVYAGYPLALGCLSLQRNNRHNSDSPLLSDVTLLISAYNEKDVIREKLENTLAFDFPGEKLEIIVVSDCSDDGTDDIVRSFGARGVRLVRQETRLGKSCGLNLGVQSASGEILVFSDANSMYERDALGILVSHFADPGVGYVVGNCAYTNKPGQPPSAESEGLYWKLETWLKEKESSFGSVVGGDGAIYAIRRKLFAPLRATDINDFLNPLQIITKGYRGVYDRAAVCYEYAGDSFAKEFHRKVRIVSRSMNAVCREPRVLLPWVQPRHWFAILSHKVLRWLAPVFLILLLSSAVALRSFPFYRAILALQILFCAFAVVGWTLDLNAPGKVPKIFYLPYYFLLVNLAALLGVGKLLTGSLSPTWQTIRHSPKPEGPAVPLAGKDS